MNTSRNRFVLALVLGACFCLAALLMGSPLAAQSTYGSVTGTVSDASGSAVPDATVTLTSRDHGLQGDIHYRRVTATIRSST